MIYSNSLLGCRVLCTLLVLRMVANTFSFSYSNKATFSYFAFCVILHT